jgi:iron(III) transport system substrate-binding protein
MKRWMGTGLVVGVALVVATACGSSSKPAADSSTTTVASGATAQPDGDITLYSGQHEETVAALVTAFEAESHIKVKVRSEDEGSLANQLLQEGSDTPADVFFAENPPALNVLDDKHLLAKTAPDTLAKVGAQYSPTSGDWVGVSARSVVLGYNTDKVQESDLPSSILDLTKPEWKGQVGFAPGETDFQPVITAIVKKDGMDAAKSWLSGLKSNGKTYEDNEALVAAINRGEVNVGILDHYYWYRLKDEVGAGGLHEKLHYFAAGDPGALVDVSGAGQTAASKHPGSAQAFLAFLVSKPAQDIIAKSKSYEYPLGSGVQTAQALRPFSEFGKSPLTIADLGDGKQALEMLQQAGLL